MIGDKIFQFLRKQKGAAGFSLIEVLVSVTIFIIIMISTAQIFKLVTDGQRSALATQNVQESLKYFLEVVAKEIRTAKISDGTCHVTEGKIFEISDGQLLFKNYYGQCAVYSLDIEGDIQRFKIARGTDFGFISPSRIRIESLEFVVDQDVDIQPTVTIKIDAWALNQGQSDSEIDIQTTVTSRQYE